jgi:TIR domain
VPLKIFISYRRQDSGPNAVGIGQYLENAFGRKNVYVDVDTHAGAKYATVIEKRLAECRVLLVLIGPDWLKLQKPNDWVQREIAYALKRDITVIPVLINGAQLPDKELLPDDIQGLLDHQAASVSVVGFRHEMAGLVRDIRSIRTRKPWRLFGGLTAAIISSLVGAIFVHSFGFYNLLERIRPLISSPGLLQLRKMAFGTAVLASGLCTLSIKRRSHIS